MHRYPEGWHEGGRHADSWLHLILFLALIAALAFVALALWRSRSVLAGGVTGTPSPTSTATDQALAELRLRYARGEIDRDDYLRRSVDLGDSTTVLPPAAPPPPET